MPLYIWGSGTISAVNCTTCGEARVGLSQNITCVSDPAGGVMVEVDKLPEEFLDL